MSKRKDKKHLFDGRMSAQEFHSKYAFPKNAKCGGCGKCGGLITRIMILAPLDEVRKRDPMIDTVAEIDPVKFMELLIPSKWGPLLRISKIFACKDCTPAAERAAAKHPDWCFADISRGPSPDRIISGKYGTSAT